MKKICFIILTCLFSLISVNTYAVAPNNSDSNKQSVPTDTWYSQPKAILRILNKLESSVNVLTVPVGGSVQYKTLTIAVKKCLTRPPSLSPDSTAFVTITDSKLATNPFSAWIFVAEPGASVFEHPLYNVSLVGCTGAMNDSPISTKPSDLTEHKGQDSSNDLEQSLERSIQSQH